MPTSPASPPQRILVGFRLVDVLRDVLDGVGAYVRHQRVRWQVQCVDADQFPKLLAPATADGAITVIPGRAAGHLRRVARSGVPTVNMLYDVSAVMPSVLSDDAEVGRVAARDFLDRGFRRFGFVGLSTPWSDARERGFAQVLRAAGHGYDRCERVTRMRRFGDLATAAVARRLADWVGSVPKPVAVLAASDAIGTRVLTACEASGVAVPDDLAVMGVDNIVHVCEFAPVPLSSVAQDFARLGYEAAAALDRLIGNGRPPVPAPAVLVPPAPVVTRRSTDVLSFDDPQVTAAMRLIHARAATGLGVNEVLAHVPVSRRWLDDQFKAVVGRTVSGEIHRRRLDHLRELLLTTDMSVKQIALRCGFPRPENMVRYFRDGYGCPPQAYRSRPTSDRGPRPTASAPDGGADARK